ncbi:MAG: molybdopterin molybdotransferase MoeA [Anaerolineaceae bacterium]|nr:molybdopterin molybdotransferase MoeA [Anaerolineaceae bacterium]
MANLFSVDEALTRILAGVTPLAHEMILLENVLGRILAQDIIAPVHVPPFANSSMDGYAVIASDIAGAGRENPVSLPVSMDIPAGKPLQAALRPGTVARIMTGAVVPDGADAVVPVEDTDTQWDTTSPEIPSEVAFFVSIQPGANIRPIGEDIQKGMNLLQAGMVLRPQEIGVLASLGLAEIPVVRRPKVAILSSGDELVAPGEPLQPGQIRDSNSYAIAALVETYGGVPVRIPTARDTIEDVRRRFHEALSHQPDVILSSAGVSVGAFDVVRTVMNELGEVNFWRVNIRPGKPLAFGHVAGIPFLGLPGNPVSAMVTFDGFVRPLLQKLGGRPDDTDTAAAILGESVRTDGRRTYFRVKLLQEDGRLVAYTTGTQSSGALSSMVLADGLLIVPENTTYSPAGSELQVRLLRRMSNW